MQDINAKIAIEYLSYVTQYISFINNFKKIVFIGILITHCDSRIVKMCCIEKSVDPRNVGLQTFLNFLILRALSVK